jgi:hypothetical protein
LILDHDEESWINFFRAENGGQPAPMALREWLGRMQIYARAGYAFDLEENEDQVRCVAAPIRDVAGRIIAAISVASAAQYMSDARMQLLTKDVVDTARRISEGLGWAAKPTPAAPLTRTPGPASRPTQASRQTQAPRPASRKTRARHLENGKSRSR